jgi:hypothetical protein
MSRFVSRRLGICLVMAAAGMTPGRAQAQTAVAPAQAERNDVSPPLRQIQVAPRGPAVAHEHAVKPVPVPAAGRGAAAPAQPDVTLQTAAPSKLAALKIKSFEGVGQDLKDTSGQPFVVSSAPSDTTGAAGATQYVQWVNDSMAIFDKKTSKTVYGPVDGNTIWAGFGGACQKLNDGDPIVLYDKAASRWFLTQFAVDDGPPYYQCIAVSTTPDATGAYARYAYRFDNFNDYGKFGVWPDAYYGTFNMFGPDDSFVGTRACAFERAKMLAGQPASMQCFDLPDAGLLPSDLDGSTAPPAGAPAYVLGFGANALNMWRFHVDWATPSSSTLTPVAPIQVAAFEPACGDGRRCVPQPSGSTLDSLGDRLMNRLAYRNFGTHESLVTNHSVRVASDGPDEVVGVRWYELRDVSTAPTVHQQGTFAPDGASRWIGSIAMDKLGNMLVGYSVSGKSVFPSISVSGRKAADAAGKLARERQVRKGAGAQTISRWGDYSTISVDPVDDCTFWFTTAYLDQGGKFNWHTRVAHTKFPDCQ